jgi:competence protein ComEC
MTRAVRLMLLAAGAVWLGAAGAGWLDPAPPAALLALAALCAWRGARGCVASSLASVACAGVVLGLLAPVDAAVPEGISRVRGRVLRLERTTRDLRIVLALEPRRRLVVTVAWTGEGWLDRRPPGLAPGARVALDVRRSSATRPGRARGFAVGAIRVVEPPSGFARVRGTPGRLRERLQRYARAQLVEREPARTGPLLAAMVSGERGLLAPSDQEALRASGLAHLAVVSGLHVGLIVLAAAGAVTPRQGREHPVRRGAVLGGALLAACLLPATPPVRRAATALILARTGCLLGRGAPPIVSLSAAVVALLAWEPGLARSWSFALSVSATAAIVLAGPGRTGRGSARLLVAPFLATWPLLVTLADRVSPWAPVANLLATPAVLPALGCGWLALVLPEPLAVPVRRGAHLAAGWVLGVAHEVMLWPGSGRLAAPAGVAWSGLHLTALGAWLTARPGRLRRAAALVLLATWSWPLRPVGPGPVGLTVVDVGQGQAVLASEQGSHVLVDAGDHRGPRGQRALLAELRRLRVRRLAGLVVTHADRDHSGGAAVVLTALAPSWLALPAGAMDDPELHDLLRLASRRGVPVRPLAAGDRLGPSPELRVLHPPAGVRRGGNEHSLVAVVRAAGVTALLPADVALDVEAALVAGNVPPALDVLVAGHHGAATSTGSMLLARTRPRIAAISAGRGNRFGHPSPLVLARLRAVGARTFVTARHGTITVSRRRERLHVASWPEPLR